MNDTQTILSSVGLAILSGGFISALVSIYKAKKENTKLEAERDNLISQATTNLLRPLNERIDQLDKLVKDLKICDKENKDKIGLLQAKVKSLTIKNNRLVNGINMLVSQIKMVGEKPIWQPTPDLCESDDT